jgi:AcrR family transcriptional regulator
MPDRRGAAGLDDAASQDPMSRTRTAQADAPKPTSRGRGRPRAANPQDTREQIMTAARQLFAGNGYDGTSLRAIATEAGVDPSLIAHYFGDKSGLLVATMHLPVNPVALIDEVLAGGLDGLGERVISRFLATWDEHHEVFSGLIRTAIASADRGEPMLAVLRGVLLPAVIAVLDGRDRELRATLMAAELIGMATLRYVLRIEPLADASAEQVVAWYAPALQALATPTGETRSARPAER